MTSTELKIGLNTNARPSSRVLKPPGGGHTNIFGEAEVSVNAPRPKYNQQNSSNLNACMGSTDANQAVEKLREEIQHSKHTGPESNGSDTAGNSNKNSPKGGPNNKDSGNAGDSGNGRSRVPPGGYSSGGFW